MTQFKSNFVAASSNSQSSNAYAIRRLALPGFVSGGSIGGVQTTSSLPGFVSGGTIFVEMQIGSNQPIQTLRES